MPYPTLPEVPGCSGLNRRVPQRLPAANVSGGGHVGWVCRVPAVFRRLEFLSGRLGTGSPANVARHQHSGCGTVCLSNGSLTGTEFST